MKTTTAETRVLSVTSCSSCPLEVHVQPAVFGNIVTYRCRGKALRVIHVTRGAPEWCPARTDGGVVIKFGDRRSLVAKPTNE